MDSYLEHSDGWKIDQLLDSALFPDLGHYPIKLLLRSGCNGEPYVVMVLPEIVVSNSNILADYPGNFVYALIWRLYGAQRTGIPQFL